MGEEEEQDVMEQSCSELALLKRCGMQEGEAQGVQAAPLWGREEELLFFAVVGFP